MSRIEENLVPYDPAGFNSTVSFISPDKNAVMALAFVIQFIYEEVL